MPNIFLFQTESGSVYHVDVDRQQWSSGTGRVWNPYLDFLITREGRLLFLTRSERNGLHRTLTTPARLMVAPIVGAEQFIAWAEANSIHTDRVLKGYVPVPQEIRDQWKHEWVTYAETIPAPSCSVLAQDTPFRPDPPDAG